MAGRAGALAHAVLQVLLAGVGLGLGVAALQVVADALKGLVEDALAPGLVVVELQLLALGAVEDDVPGLGGEVLPGGVQGETVLLGQGLEVHPGDAVRADGVPAHGLDGPAQDGLGLVRDDPVRVHPLLAAETHAGGAGAEGVVEGEHPGRQLLQGDAAVLAGVVLGKAQVPLLPQQVHHHETPGEVGGRLHAVRQPGADVRPDDEPVHDDLDGVLLVLL